MGGMGFPPPIKSKGLFMKMRERIIAIPHAIKYPFLLNYFALMNLLHMEELLETQGVHALREYLKKFDEKEGKSAAALKKEGNSQNSSECAKQQRSIRNSVFW